MMLPFLLTLWSWTACPDPGPLTFRVESVRRYPVAYREGRDDNGALISEPIYNVWAPTFISEGPEMSAEVPCEPASGEVCTAIVTAIDEAGNLDLGDDCGD